MTDTEPEVVTGVYVVCPSCEAHYQTSPTNYVSVRDFDYCPNCGEELPDDAHQEITHEPGWIPPEHD